MPGAWGVENPWPGEDAPQYVQTVELTGGDSLESNIQLVLNNAIVASKTAAELCK